MSLPKIVRPQATLTLVSEPKKKVVVQAFTIGEEKILNIAKETDSVKAIFDAILQIVEHCIVKPTNMDVRKLPVFDVVKIFVTILGISKGTISTLKFRCNAEGCNRQIDKDVDLNDIDYGKVVQPELIPVGSNLKIKLKFPSIQDSINLTENMDNGMDETEATLRFYASLIDRIYDGEECTKTEDVSPEEVYEWFLNLQEETLEKFKNFIENMPQMKLTVDVECTCGKKATFVYTELADFFS